MRYLAVLAAVPTLLGLSSTAAGGRPQAGVPSSHVAAASWQSTLAFPHVTNPTGMAIDLRGNPRLRKWMYTADASTRHVVKFGTGGSILGSWAYGTPQEMGGSAAVVVDRHGNVLVADPAINRVSKYSPSGTLLASWGGFMEPNGVATDRLGNVYVSERGSSRVTKLPESGPPALSHIDIHCGTSAYLATPIGIAVDPTSTAYVYVAATCPAAADLGPLKETADEVVAYSATLQYQNAWIGETLHGGFAKEQEQWVTVESIATDRWGNWYTAGVIRPLGAQKTARGIFIHYPHSYGRGYWFIPGSGAARGLTVDGPGWVYVTRDRSVLRHAPLPPRHAHLEARRVLAGSHEPRVEESTPQPP